VNRFQAKKLLTVLILVAGGALAGCGDGSTGYTMQSPYRSDVRTVAVPIWVRGKDVYRRELEFRLTEAIVKNIELSTPYKVTKRECADTLLEGSIEKVTQRVTSFDPNTGQPREKEIVMTVSFTWTDLRTGAVLAKRSKYAVTSNYIPASPFNEDFFEGSEDGINRLAARIVEQMEEDWGNE
jgi:hypothetical protein